MQLKTILNRVEPFQSFVYGKAHWVAGGEQPALEVQLLARRNGRAICSGCGRRGPGYDRLPERRFEFVPLWGMAVYFVYALRRVDCPTCGVTVERVPWAVGKCHLTTSYRWFLARWAKYLSWEEVATIFNTPWRNVYESVKHAVIWGVFHLNLSSLEAIGVDHEVDVVVLEVHRCLSHDFRSWPCLACGVVPVNAPLGLEVDHILLVVSQSMMQFDALHFFDPPLD
jgi:hypothetical protein